MDRTLDESSKALCPKVYVIQKISFSLWLDKLKQIQRNKFTGTLVSRLLEHYDLN